MTNIISVGREGITEFMIQRGTDDPTSTFNVTYYTCDGGAEPNIWDGDLIKIYLSDPKHHQGYEDVFMGRIDNIVEVENNEGFSYQISGRDMGAILNEQKFTLFEGTGGEPNSNPGPLLKPGGGVNLMNEILKLMISTDLTILRTSIGNINVENWGYFQFSTDAAEDNVAAFLNPLSAPYPGGPKKTSFKQGEWHFQRKYYNRLSPQILNKSAALDEICKYINANTNEGIYNWCIDNHGALLIFTPDKPEYSLNINFNMDCVSEISIGNEKTGITNKIQGWGHERRVKTTEPASTDRIHVELRNGESIAKYGERDAEPIDDPYADEDEIRTRCEKAVSPWPKYHIQVTLDNYSNISLATSINISGRARASGKTFTLTNYTISGQTGDYQTVLEGEVWNKSIENPSLYKSIQTVAENEASKLYNIPVRVLKVDTDGAMVKVQPNSGGNTPQWIPYLRRTNNVPDPE